MFLIVIINYQRKVFILNKKITFLTIGISLLIVCFLRFDGCTDTVTNTQTDNLEVSYMSTTDTVDTGILTLDTVKILLKDIKCNVASTNDSNNFKTGPFVLFLNLSSSINTIGSAYIPVGTYDKIKFEVHKLEDTEAIPDSEFVEGSSRFSVVAKGHFMGTRFVYKSDKPAKQNLQFPNSLYVSPSGKSNITLKISPLVWFIDESTSTYMDPNDPSNRSKIDNNIKENIKANFKAFKDNDKNGIPDN